MFSPGLSSAIRTARSTSCFHGAIEFETSKLWPENDAYAESGPTPCSVAPAGCGAIEIEFVAGVRMRITGTVDAATLKAAVAALADGRPR
jgi:hypothetical protein